MKIRFATSLVVALIFVLLGWFATNAMAAVIFQDDFESSSSAWKCTDTPGDGPSNKWSSGWTTCGSTTGFGAEWKMGSGYNSINALYAWKKQGVPNGYRSESERWLTGSDVKTELYHRWYMKVPTPATFNKTTTQGGGMKFWRYILRENGYSTPPEIYFNVRSSTKLATGDLVMILTRTGQFYHLINFSDINDNAWHCHELRLKVNTNNNSDGIIQYWVDGVLKATHNNIDFSDGTRIPDIAFHRFAVGIGNASDEAWDQTEWSAIAFDNIVVSTDYVGPIGGGTPPPPLQPLGPYI